MTAARLLLIALLITVFGVWTTPIHAQSPSPAPTSKVQASCGLGCQLTSSLFNYFINGQTSIEGALGHTVFCSLTGFSMLNQCGGYLYDGKETGFLIYDRLPNGGAIGSLSNVTVAFYNNPPTSSVTYLASLGENIGLSPKTAYAQQVGGSGNGVIRPVLELWQVTRNISYLAFIVIFMAVGFMIMFRRKINPQTVISVQAALPSLIIGLILITFSYFIAALAIDISFIAVQIVAQIFASSGVSNILGKPEDLHLVAQNSNIFQMFLNTGVNTAVSGIPFSAVQNQYTGTLNSIAPQIFGPTGSYVIPSVLGAIAGGLMFLGPFAWAGLGVGIGIGAASQYLVPILVIAVLLIALFVQLFKLVFQLIITYVQILVFTIAGPFLILYGSLPGNGGATSFWFRGLLANSLVFVFVFGAFLFAGAIIGSQNALTSTLPLLGGIQGDFIKILIGYGVILGTPAIPNMVRGLFKVQFPPELIKEAVSGFSAGTGAVQSGWNLATRNARTYEEARAKAQQEKEVSVIRRRPSPEPANIYEAFARGLGRLR